jgi:hypothetical protein
MPPDKDTSSSTTNTDTGTTTEDTTKPTTTEPEKKTEEPEKKDGTVLGTEGEKKVDDPEKKVEEPTSKVPEKYELKLPEKSTLDATALERTAATARKLGLSNEAAQGTLEFLNQELTDREAAILESNRPGGADYSARVHEWEDTALKDTEVGGSPDKLKATAELSLQVLDKFGTPDVKTFLHETGYGSHPSILRFLAKIGKAMSEGTLVQPGSLDGGKRDPADVLYGTTTPKE